MTTVTSDTIVHAASSIFEQPVIVKSTFVADVSPDAIPRELKLANVAVKRQLEYAAGRIAARKAIEATGHNSEFPKTGDARQPLWPNGLVGSISHTDAIAVAVVALLDNFDGVGLDVERMQEIDLSTAEQFLTQRELTSLADSANDIERFALLRAFSYKEALYKCVYPKIQKYIDFLEVELDYHEGRILASCVDEDHPASGLVSEIIGDSRIVGNHVISACWLPRD